MNGLQRGLCAAIFVAGATLVGCSGGASIPAAGTTSAPTGGGTTATSTPTSSGGTTPPTAVGATATPTSSSGGTATATPTSSSGGSTTPTPTPIATATTVSTNGCPPSYPPEPAQSTTPWLSGGGNIPIPKFADLSGTVNVPSNSASSGTTLTFQLDQNTFTDEAGNGNIPTPPPGDTGILYAAAYLTPAQTITFGGTETIIITATAPCELPTGKTYVAFAYANGGGFTHSELSPTAGYTVTQSSSGAVSFSIDLSSSGGLQPTGTLLETVFASK